MEEYSQIGHISAKQSSENLLFCAKFKGSQVLSHTRYYIEVSEELVIFS